MDSQMQRDREAKADEAINAINRKAGRNMPQAVGTAIALIAIILLCLWASPILFVVLVVLYRRSKGGGQPKREKPKEPEFKGPVYTVDYREVDEDEAH